MESVSISGQIASELSEVIGHPAGDGELFGGMETLYPLLPMLKSNAEPSLSLGAFALALHTLHALPAGVCHGSPHFLQVFSPVTPPH